jgi:hypothetical protein
MGRLRVWAEGGKGRRETGRIAAGPSRPKPERGKGFAPSFVFFSFKAFSKQFKNQFENILTFP